MKIFTEEKKRREKIQELDWLIQRQREDIESLKVIFEIHCVGHGRIMDLFRWVTKASLDIKDLERKLNLLESIPFV